MDFAPPLLHRALSRARAAWLAGDPAAWSRYAHCLTRLQRPSDGRPSGDRAATLRPARRVGLRPPRGLA